MTGVRWAWPWMRLAAVRTSSKVGRLSMMEVSMANER
jgi:hypothetical protein